MFFAFVVLAVEIVSSIFFVRMIFAFRKWRGDLEPIEESNIQRLEQMLSKEADTFSWVLNAFGFLKACVFGAGAFCTWYNLHYPPLALCFAVPTFVYACIVLKIWNTNRKIETKERLVHNLDRTIEICLFVICSVLYFVVLVTVAMLILSDWRCVLRNNTRYNIPVYLLPVY